ncbi:MAG: RNA polymerase sigma factor [Bacteroidales bacterium]|nr:RNA polymerase sigma factor [Bacteroidales bacterium]
MKTENEQLVLACLKHDPRAQKQLYDRFAPTMLALCIRYMGNRDEAQDVLQDGFVKVFNSLRNLKDAAQLRSWIERIMINTALSSLRKKVDLVSIDEIPLGGNDFQVVNDLTQYDIDKIQQAITELPRMLRTTFNLREVEGYSDKEIAQQLGVGESTVRSNASRARQMLIAKLEKMGIHQR